MNSTFILSGLDESKQFGIAKMILSKHPEVISINQVKDSLKITTSKKVTESAIAKILSENNIIVTGNIVIVRELDNATKKTMLFYYLFIIILIIFLALMKYNVRFHSFFFGI